MPDKIDIHARSRFRLGAVIFLIGFFSPALIPFVTFSDLPLKWKVSISGALAVGIPDLFSIIAIAVMGKPGFLHLKKILTRLIKKFGPPETVSRYRYRFGLVMFGIPLIMAWLLPYIGHLLPFYQENLIIFSVGGDLLLILSLFVLGGEFWDKLQSLFIYDAKVQLPQKENG